MSGPRKIMSGPESGPEVNALAYFQNLINSKFRPANMKFDAFVTNSGCRQSRQGDNPSTIPRIQVKELLFNKAISSKAQKTARRAECSPSMPLSKSTQSIMEMQELKNILKDMRTHEEKLQEEAKRQCSRMETLWKSKCIAEKNSEDLRSLLALESEKIHKLSESIQTLTSAVEKHNEVIKELRIKNLELSQCTISLNEKLITAYSRASCYKGIIQSLETDILKLKTRDPVCYQCNTEARSSFRQKKRATLGPRTDRGPMGYCPRVGEYYIEFVDPQNRHFSRNELVLEALKRVLGADCQASSSRGKGRVYFPTLHSAIQAFETLQKDAVIKIPKLKLELKAQAPRKMV